MRTERGFVNADRYGFDFNQCSTQKGFAQVDTSQDASYFGTWANPFKLVVFNYCEGDTCLELADNEQEFVECLRNIKKWNEDNGHRFCGIDPGFNEELKARFIALGLEDLLH